MITANYADAELREITGLFAQIEALEEIIFSAFGEDGFDGFFAYLEHDNPLPCNSDTCLKCKAEKYYDTYLRKGLL